MCRIASKSSRRKKAAPPERGRSGDATGQPTSQRALLGLPSTGGGQLSLVSRGEAGRCAHAPLSSGWRLTAPPLAADYQQDTALNPVPEVVDSYKPPPAAVRRLLILIDVGFMPPPRRPLVAGPATSSHRRMVSRHPSERSWGFPAQSFCRERGTISACRFIAGVKFIGAASSGAVFAKTGACVAGAGPRQSGLKRGCSRRSPDTACRQRAPNGNRLRSLKSRNVSGPCFCFFSTTSSRGFPA